MIDHIKLPIAYAGNNTNAMLAFFNQQIKKHAIQVFTDVYFPITHKNPWIGL